MRLGRCDDALDTFVEARAEAEREGNRGVAADVLLERGRALLASERHGEAEEALRAAAGDASACGARGVASAAEVDRARVAASLLRRRRALPGTSARAREALRRARELLAPGDEGGEARTAVAEAEVDLAEGADREGAGRAVRGLTSAADTFARLRLLDEEVSTLVAVAGAAAVAARLDPSPDHDRLVRRALWRALDLVRVHGLSRHAAAVEAAVVHHAAHFGPRPEGRPLLDPGAPPAAGTTPYVRLAPVGGGGFAQVFRAFDPIRARVVALKVLRLDGVADPATRAAIEQTARDEWTAASDKRHPGMATVLGVGTDPEGRPYVVQEWVEGPTLEAVMASDPRPSADRVMRVVGDVAGALAALDAYGIAHRDVKPSNVLLRGDPPRAVLVDFGLAAGVFRPLAHDRRTLVGGTPPYAPPEQMDAAPGNREAAGRLRKADVYALGVVAYEWLDGPPLLERGDRPLEERLKRARRRLAVPLRKRRPDLPAAVCALVDSMVSPRPDRRPDAVDVAETASLLARSAGPPRGGGTT
jgi:hypothetical protein